jgi:ribosomal protein L11 methyltransferase
MFVWKKRLPESETEAWVERLNGIVAPERVTVVETAGARFPKLEVYCPTQKEARTLAARFGGAVREIRDEQWQPSSVTAPGKPLSIAGRLYLTGRPEELETLRDKNPLRPVLCIPAAMAFGTGEHATTAMCLRLLAEVSRQKKPLSWEMLDLGTGSGVLALAGRVFGAKKALGLDNDPHAVRTAKSNAALNELSAVQFKKVDLIRAWQPERTWPLIAANLFSELLIELSPRIARGLEPGGHLVASGVLASQAVEVERAFLAEGLEKCNKRGRGRWVAFLWGKPIKSTK